MTGAVGGTVLPSALPGDMTQVSAVHVVRYRAYRPRVDLLDYLTFDVDASGSKYRPALVYSLGTYAKCFSGGGADF